MAKALSSAWEPVIGLEVHVQLKTRTKMFCRCENRFGAEPNSLTCPVCLGQPGSLPVINRTAIEYSAMAGLAFGCKIPPFTKFDRKNYYYPDLPKGYQISQFDRPICDGGGVTVTLDGVERTIRLVRIHLEEDAGKNVHVEGRPESRVDLNRAGVPLMEIVSEPDIYSSAEAVTFLKILRLTMIYLGISDCNMEEGSLRCDCNVSIRPRGSDQLETRTEIKNLNSFTFIQSALEFEISRQIQLREAGHQIVQETRLYDPERNETRSMRGKEEAHDYRYFPEPDLTPLELREEWILQRRESIPTLPGEAYRELVETHGLPEVDSEILVQDPAVVAYFHGCVELLGRPKKTGNWAKKISNWIINDLFQEMNERRVSIQEVGLPPARLVEIVQAVEDGLVSVNNAREVFRRMVGNECPAREIIEELGVGMISDDSLIRQALEEAIQANPSVVEDVRSGKKNARNFFVGQVMRATKGKANPGQVMSLIDEILGG